jgi:hypothetical protein
VSFWQRMLEEDKSQHMIVAYMGVVALQFYLPIYQSVIALLVAGFIKELWDLWMGTGFCWYDITANTLGVAFAFCWLAIAL